ncbi:hypothetical protein yc1106_00315 [Curvularia clavata]|uniref:NB-ARC domain-containing protein n=1 Tax=Curvularia clavata TaxID=95742 RepID=A0A9Q9DP83_CURCL|nr:hypothetical protein yc1106_00315 [Curvularia clavata]
MKNLTFYSIVLIHGLRGHPRRTWEDAAAPSSVGNDAAKKSKSLPIRSFLRRRSSKFAGLETKQEKTLSSSSTLLSSPSTIFWPEDYLVSDIPNACVWTYGYNADVIGGIFQANNKNSISQHGQDLSVRLEREIGNEKPIVFVVHSLGGIILKDVGIWRYANADGTANLLIKAIRRSDTVRERTKLIVFLGTPHRGSTYANWGQIASKLARIALQDSNKKIVDTLEVNNEVLDNIHEEFKRIVYKGGIKIHSFQEARGVTGVRGLEGKFQVVDDYSSKLDLPRDVEIVESIDANHMQMARCSSRDDQVYRVISGVLKAFVEQELKNQEMPLTLTKSATEGMKSSASSDTLFIMPFSRDESFIGREDSIVQIDDRRAAASTHTRIALVGLGGVGKSQIAIEYAYRARDAVPQMSVLWIHASDSSRFQQGYKSIADKLMLPGRDDPTVDVLKLVHDWLLDSGNGQWLMILDNVDNNDVFSSDNQSGMPLESYLPPAAHGTILITSRNKVVATNLVDGPNGIIHVEPMGEEDALALLQTKVSLTESDQADAKSLVQVLEYIPLAVTHAAAYIRTRSDILTIGSYLNLFHESETNQMHLLSKDELKDIRRDPSIRYPVIATWQISFEHIQKMEQSAADLLALMSMFDKQGIPRQLLQGETSELEFADALAPLLSFSFVRVELGRQAVTIHRLVQLSMRRWLKREKEIDKWVGKSTQVLEAVFPTGRYSTWEECQVLLPHFKEVVSHETKDKGTLVMKVKTSNRAAQYLLLKGEYRIMEELCRSSVGILENIFESEHPQTLETVNILVTALIRQGKYEEAEGMSRRVLQGYEKTFGQEHPNTLLSVNNLASVLFMKGMNEEAEAMLRRTLRAVKKMPELEVQFAIGCANNLAEVLAKQGKLEKAEAIHRRLLQTNEEVFGHEHPDTLLSISNLGKLLEEQRRFSEAEAMYCRALEGRERVLGLEHENTLYSMTNLGRLFHKQKRYSEAIELYRRAHDGYLKVLGAQDSVTVKTRKLIELAEKHQLLWSKKMLMLRVASEQK